MFQSSFSPSLPRGPGRPAPQLRLMALTMAPCEAMAPCTARRGTSPALSSALPPAKLDPPALQSIQSIPFQTDCIALAWEVARSNAHMELQCELRYRAPEDPAWALVSDAGAAGPGRASEQELGPSPPLRALPGFLQWEQRGAHVGGGRQGAPLHALRSAHTGASPCSRQEPAQPSLRLPPGHRHRRPGRHHTALWLPLWHAVPLPDAVPAELGTGLLE